MQTVCLELSKYVLAFLMAFYALAAYRGAVIRNEDKRKKIYRIQNIIMVIVHFTGYLIMYVVYDDMNYIYCTAGISWCSYYALYGILS